MSKHRRIINKDFRDYYRKRTSKDISKRLHEYDNDRIISLFTKKLAEKVVENKSGVHVKRLGYFYNHRVPWIIFPIKTKKHTYKYVTTFIPTKGSSLKYWSFDFKWQVILVKKLKEKINAGYGYLNMIKGLSKWNGFYLGAPYHSKLQLKSQKQIENEI